MLDTRAPSARASPRPARSAGLPRKLLQRREAVFPFLAAADGTTGGRWRSPPSSPKFKFPNTKTEGDDDYRRKHDRCNSCSMALANTPALRSSNGAN